MQAVTAIRRRVFDPLFDRLSGGTLLEEWRTLEASQYLPETALRARQQQRLAPLLKAAHDRSPFYRRRFRQAGVLPGDIRSPDDLRKLPVLTKQEIRAHREEILASGIDGATLCEFRTGGSTGVPLAIFVEEHVSHRRNACARRSNRWTGWEIGEPVGAVWGNPHLPRTLAEWLRHELLEPVIYLDTMDLTPAAIEAFAARWRRVRPTLLFGHAHSLYMLALAARERGIDAIRPRGIISTSMMLLSHERAAIEQAFGVRVFDRYGCEETGLVACECERHDGMHVNIDHLVVEFVRDDGTAAAAGETGNVVITDLLNQAMPLIRYSIEDIAQPLTGPCSCGRGLPRMTRLAGRVADFLRRSDGSMVAGVSLIENSLTRFHDIEQMQIVQDSLETIRLRVVPGPGFHDCVREALASYFSETFPGAKIELETVDAIGREPNGKFRFAICNVRD